MNEDPRYKIVSVCDKRQVKLDAVKERFGVSDDNFFLDEKDFFAKKRAESVSLLPKIKIMSATASPL